MVRWGCDAARWKQEYAGSEIKALGCRKGMRVKRLRDWDLQSETRPCY